MNAVNEGLTLKQAAFVEHITSPETFGNGTQAAIKAGYSGNYQTVAQTASENLKKPQVQNAIQKRLAPIMDANECLEELSTLARAKPSKDGAVNTNHKIKTLELVGKAHRLFDDKPLSLADEVTKMLAALREEGLMLCPADPTDNSNVVDADESE